MPNHVSEPPAVDEAPSAGEMAARLLVSTPLALCQKKSVMMDRSLTIITTGGLRGFAALADPGGGCCEAPSPTSPRKIKLEAGVRPLEEVMGTCSPPRN